MGLTAEVAALDTGLLDRAIGEALAEDIGAGDLTTDVLVPAGDRCRAEVSVTEPGVVCGLPAVAAVFRALDPDVQVDAVVDEGRRLLSASVVARVEGRARAVLTGERTALNFLARLSGVATLARAFVDEVAGTGVAILDTRKTTPGLRALEKYATRVGGATNHRSGLDDGVLVKDNHLRLVGGIGPAVAALRERSLRVEVEVETLEDVSEALAAGADVLLLDNMPVDRLREAVALAKGRAGLEASGGVSLATVRAIADTGVDVISVGAITRSARSLDVSLEVL
jgi:nicotinate-nucleotide pyrophosphorylase (carboxylating)